MKESARALAERMQGQIIGEINLIKKAYPGSDPLGMHLSAIEGYVDIAMGCLKIDTDQMNEEKCKKCLKQSIIKYEGNNMANTLAIIQAIKIYKAVIKNMPEEVKRAIDREIDKIEDKYKEGSIKDKATEYAMKIVRGIIEVPDYPDVIDEPPES